MYLLPTQASASPFGLTPPPISASAASPSDTSSTGTATVGANDFLQLLVTELKNQDPTANKDPNEYVNQLVQVNSLEQLIQINEKVGGSSSTGGASSNIARGAVAPAVVTPAGGVASATGNLSAPAASSAASRIGNALGLSPQSSAVPGSLRSIVNALKQQSSPTNPASPAR